MKDAFDQLLLAVDKNIIQRFRGKKWPRYIGLAVLFVMLFLAPTQERDGISRSLQWLIFILCALAGFKLMNALRDPEDAERAALRGEGPAYVRPHEQARSLLLSIALIIAYVIASVTVRG